MQRGVGQEQNAVINMTVRTRQKRLDLLALCHAFNIKVPGKLAGVRETMCYEELACLEMVFIQRLRALFATI